MKKNTAASKIKDLFVNPSNVIYCHDCGKMMSASARTCPKCGKSLRQQFIGANRM